MLSEFESIRIEGHAKNYVGSPEGKAMAKRLLELNNEIKTVLIDKENAEKMAAEAAKKMIELQNELQEKSMQLGDAVCERDALLEELERYEPKNDIDTEDERQIMEIFDRMREAAEKNADKSFDDGNTERVADASVLVTLMGVRKKHDA